MATCRQHSVEEWNSKGTNEDINSGSLQRIADAVEKMAGNYTQLQNDRDYYRTLAADKSKAIEKLSRKISALKGVITKLKKQLEEARENQWGAEAAYDGAVTELEEKDKEIEQLKKQLEENGR